MKYIPEEIRKAACGMPDDQLNTYIDKVWECLERMKPGNAIIIKEHAKMFPQLFIECAKNYMREHEYQDGLSFADGYDILRKHDLIWNNASTSLSTQQKEKSA